MNKEDKLAALPAKVGYLATADDVVLNLIMDNTYQTSSKKDAENIFKAIAMVAAGTSRATSCKRTGISVSTYAKWVTKPWYKQCLAVLQEQMDNDLDANLTGLAHKATEKLADRIEHGDFIFDKNNDLVRKPMSGRDIGVNFATIFDKRQLLRNKPTSVSESKTTKETLDDIASRFEDMATIDAEFTVEKDDR